jgi:5'-nucleotidase (lipoprotein e(P4) family)
MNGPTAISHRRRSITNAIHDRRHHSIGGIGMRLFGKGTFALSWIGGFLFGAVLGGQALTGLMADPTPAKNAVLPFPMTDRIGGNIWLQTSAEYRACCLGVYKCAEDRLEVILKEAKSQPKRPAIVMDLDETVFDNSSFETFLYKSGKEYDPALWDVYEEKYAKDVTLIPGAKKLIEFAEARGVTVVYISNRSERFRKSTVEVLDHNKISIVNIDRRLLLKDKNGSDDKSSRRDLATGQYKVLLYFGDNLRDFSEAFKARKIANGANPEQYLDGINERQAMVDVGACHWGVDWFVIPNPVYGEWEKLIGSDPMAIMHPTSMKSSSD